MSNAQSMIKECGTCLDRKPLTEFYYRKDTETFRKECKQCKKEKVLTYQKENQSTYHRNRKKSTYNITDEEYDKAMAKTECAICEKHITIKNRAFDHCHETGKFRDVLCTKCNISIGGLGDNSKGLRRALKYLEEHESN